MEPSNMTASVDGPHVIYAGVNPIDATNAVLELFEGKEIYVKQWGQASTFRRRVYRQARRMEKLYRVKLGIEATRTEIFGQAFIKLKPSLTSALHRAILKGQPPQI